ncbi:MAG: hypothetical protein JNL62_12225 [Bryobacterales bacterium]|nr:hypothetical protein [Bryobacterales bacterium]
MTPASSLPLLAGVTAAVFFAVRRALTPGEKLGAILGIAVGIAPAAWVMAARQVPSKLVVGYAVLFFAASVLLKWAVHRNVLSKHIHPKVRPPSGAVLQGSFSAACELGVALSAFHFFLPGLSFWEVFGFGAGAAAVEALMVSLMSNAHAGNAEGSHVDAQLATMRAGPRWLCAAVPPMERAIATTGHIACRGLVAAALASDQWWPAAVAFAVFAATDGLAWYALQRKWAFGRPAVALRFYGLLSIPALAAAFAWSAAL